MTRRALITTDQKLTEDQLNDLKETFGVQEIIYLPQDLKERINHPHPELSELKLYIRPVLKYLNRNLNVGDIIVINGDPAATYLVAHHSLICGFVPLQPVTRYEMVEEKLSNGEVRTKKVLKHVKFRKYGT